MATRANKVILTSIVVIVLAWVISAIVGTIYLISPSDAPASGAIAGNTIALVIFALTTAIIWIGLLVGVLVVAWKWLSPKSSQEQPPPRS